MCPKTPLTLPPPLTMRHRPSINQQQHPAGSRNPTDGWGETRCVLTHECKESRRCTAARSAPSAGHGRSEPFRLGLQSNSFVAFANRCVEDNSLFGGLFGAVVRVDRDASMKSRMVDVHSNARGERRRAWFVLVCCRCRVSLVGGNAVCGVRRSETAWPSG